MLHICIPAYNEAQTIGVLLWRIRTVFQSYSREYEVVVYNDSEKDPEKLARRAMQIAAEVCVAYLV